MRLIFCAILLMGYLTPLSLFGQEKQEVSFTTVIPQSATIGYWISIPRSVNYSDFSNLPDTQQEVLTAAKVGLIHALEGRSFPTLLNTYPGLQEALDTVVSYKIAYGVSVQSPSEEYIFRWARTGPVLPKSVTISVVRQSDGWAIRNSSESKYFTYLANTRYKYHQRIFFPKSSKYQAVLSPINDQCRIPNTTSYVLDGDCVINYLLDLSESDRESFFNRLK